MNTTFMTSPRLLFTSESVTEGHPDKMCDQISDAVLDACLEQDPLSRVACEVATKTGFVMLMGEITTKAVLNYDELAREVITSIGYDSSEKGFCGGTCGVLVAIAKQIRTSTGAFPHLSRPATSTTSRTTWRRSAQAIRA